MISLYKCNYYKYRLNESYFWLPDKFAKFAELNRNILYFHVSYQELYRVGRG